MRIHSEGNCDETVEEDTDSRKSRTGARSRCRQQPTVWNKVAEDHEPWPPPRRSERERVYWERNSRMGGQGHTVDCSALCLGLLLPRLPGGSWVDEEQKVFLVSNTLNPEP
jgi:hypothetical protein